MGMVETCYGPVEQEVMARAGNIRLLICDVDGVLSDGLIFMGNNGEELKAFNVRDGYGIRRLKTRTSKWRSSPAAPPSCWKTARRRSVSPICIRAIR